MTGFELAWVILKQNNQAITTNISQTHFVKWKYLNFGRYFCFLVCGWILMSEANTWVQVVPERTQGRPWGRLRVWILSIKKT